MNSLSLKRLVVLNVPGGPVVKNPPASAGDAGLIPWSKKTAHAAGQLSPWATSTEWVLWSPGAATSEAQTL